MAELYRTAWSMVVPEIVTLPAQLDAATSELDHAVDVYQRQRGACRAC